MRARLVALAVAAVVPLAAAEGAAACSCAGPPTESGVARDRDGAVIGRLLAVREVDPPEQGEPIGSGDPMDYVYRVGRVFDGGPGLKRGRRIRVRSARGSATCGLPRGRGRLFGLFLRREEGRWRGNLCGVTTPRRMRRYFEADASSGTSPGTPACG